MGTTIDLTIDAPNSPQLGEQVIQRLHDFNHLFSAHDNSSVLSQVNNASGISYVQVPSSLFQLIAIGKQHSLNKEDNLNIALGPVIAAWNIGFSNANVPQHLEIEKRLRLTDPNDILLDEQNSSVFLRKKGMRLDLGSLAKGYVADNIIDYLQRQKATSGMINLGGNIKIFGDNPERLDKFWHIGIQNPTAPRGNHVALLPLKNSAIATSGHYERYFQVNHITYSHIIHNVSGYPVSTDVSSLTIVAPTALETELWTTKLSASSSSDALTIINKTPNIEGLIITKDNQMLTSKHLVAFIPK